MTALRVFASRLAAFWSKRRMEARMEEELRSHMEMLAEENRRRGMPPEEAWRAARREFGGLEQVRETWRDVRGFAPLERLAQDFRHALRGMRRDPGFTLLVAAVLAVGIGAGTTVFSILNTLFLRPLVYVHPEQLVTIGEAPRGQYLSGPMGPVRYLNYEDWKAQANSFQHMAAFQPGQFHVTAAAGPEQVRGERVAPGFFELLGVQPKLGRGFTAEDYTSGAVVLLAEEFWRNALGGPPDIVGRSIRVDGGFATVVGVMPGNLRATLIEGGARLWAPLIVTRSERNRETPAFQVLARLKPGATLAGARADMQVVARRLAAEHPATNKDWVVRVDSLQETLAEAASAPASRVLVTMVAFLLLIACANVASLLIGRGAGRQKEVALRIAMGAGRWRIVRQFLCESLAFALAGGLGGIAVAAFATSWCSRKLAPVMPIEGITTFEIDGRVLGFTLLASLATALVFGILPALRGSQVKVVEVLKEGGPGHSGGAARHRLSATLVLLEVTLSVVLVTSAGLLSNSIRQYWRLDWGFPLDHRLMAGVAPPERSYKSDARLRFYAQLLARAKDLPGVQSAALVNRLPLDLGASSTSVAAENQQPVQAGYRAISPEYHATLGIALRAGRGLTEADLHGGRPVALVSESLAKKLWPGQDPLAGRIRVNGTWWSVAGVTADVAQSIAPRPRYEVCLPYTQADPRSLRIVLRTAADPAALAPALRQAVRELDPDLPLADLRTLHRATELLRAPYEFVIALLCGFAAAAVLLAGAGIYAVSSRAVAIRTREIGIRVALGADARHVLVRVLRGSLKLAMAGTMLGSLLSLLMIKALLARIWWMSPVSAVAWILPVALLMAVLAVTASLGPARRATGIAPAAALRAE